MTSGDGPRPERRGAEPTERETPGRAVVGTAGHIDHGKTALVRALTGVDTDRLREEKERGITIELGFAELREDGEPVLGLVDVPGHEDFVRTMVAGASGMDLVLLVVAADEGVMPQTREHLAVVELLAVPRMVVALTKCDLVEEAWLELVEEEVRETLAHGPWPEAPLLRTSAETGGGVETLRTTLFREARRGKARRVWDLVRLPVDRSFTVQGTGTVVTGTLWSGRLRTSDTVRILPSGMEARIRGIQHHGRDVPEAQAGARTAVALSGTGVDRRSVARGDTLVADDAWRVSPMLTVRVRVLPGTGWQVEQNQRLHVHLGTQEVRARCAVLRGDRVEAGGEGWIQLRLEAPVAARARDRVVLRSFSPVTTIAGGIVAEPDPPKRKSLDEPLLGERLLRLVEGDPAEAVGAACSLAGWAGSGLARLPVLTGLTPDDVARGAAAVREAGGAEVRGRLFAPEVVARADERLLREVATGHAEHPLAPTVPLARVRRAVPAWAGAGLDDARLQALAAAARVEILESGARAVGWTVTLTDDQEQAVLRLAELFRAAGLQPPERDEIPEEMRDRADLDALLGHLEEEGTLVALDERFRIHREALDRGVEAVRAKLGGRSDLGPADFREALPVTRRHLLPILGWMDREGITLRSGDGREILPPA